MCIINSHQVINHHFTLPSDLAQFHVKYCCFFPPGCFATWVCWTAPSLSERCVCFHWLEFSLQPLSPPARAVFYKGSYFPFERPLLDTTSKENQSQWDLPLKRGRRRRRNGVGVRGGDSRALLSSAMTSKLWHQGARLDRRELLKASKSPHVTRVKWACAATRRVWRRFPSVSLWRDV